jgi:hypothetical protein
MEVIKFMKKTYLLIIIALAVGFIVGMQWKHFWYLDQCLDMGGGMNPGNHPICVVGE